MVSRIIAVFAGLSMLEGPAQAALDLTPIPSQYEVEGVRFPNVYFVDGAAKIFYTPPRDWKPTGGGKRLAFNLPGSQNFQASIERLDLKQPAPFSGDTLKELVADAQTTLPGVATEITAPAEEANPITVLQSETYQVSFTYTFRGRRFTTSVFYVNLGGSRLRCCLEAPQSDFAPLQRVFQASLCSFYR